MPRPGNVEKGIGTAIAVGFPVLTTLFAETIASKNFPAALSIIIAGIGSGMCGVALVIEGTKINVLSEEKN